MSQIQGNDMEVDKLELEFQDLKERVFREQAAKLKKEIEDINAGTHPQFVAQVVELEKLRNEKIRMADEWQQYKVHSIRTEFKAEKKFADDELKEEKRQYRDRMVSTFAEKKKAMSDEKNTMAVSEYDRDSRIPKRTLRRRGNNANDKFDEGIALQVPPPPQISFTLSDQEIDEDFNSIAAGTSNNSIISVMSFEPTRTENSVLEEVNASSVRNVVRAHGLNVKKGDKVEITQDATTTWRGTITMATPVQIHISCEDGSAARFLVSQIKSGKYVIKNEAT